MNTPYSNINLGVLPLVAPRTTNTTVDRAITSSRWEHRRYESAFLRRAETLGAIESDERPQAWARFYRISLRIFAERRTSLTTSNSRSFAPKPLTSVWEEAS